MLVVSVFDSYARYFTLIFVVDPSIMPSVISVNLTFSVVVKKN